MNIEKFVNMTHDERSKMFEDDPNSYVKFTNDVLEEAILSSGPKSQLKMRAYLARLNRDTRNYGRQIDRASYVFGRMHESFLEMNAHLQTFTNMVGDE